MLQAAAAADSPRKASLPCFLHPSSIPPNFSPLPLLLIEVVAETSVGVQTRSIIIEKEMMIQFK